MHITEISQKEIIEKAYNDKHQVIIEYKGKNRNNCLVVDYTDEDVTFVWNNKRITEKQDQARIVIEYDEHWFRDLICRKEFNMTWEQLQNYIESAYRRGECEYDQIGYKYGSSSAKKIYITINDIKLIAAMTYDTVTGVKLEDGTRISQNYSVTSSRWESNIL